MQVPQWLHKIDSVVWKRAWSSAVLATASLTAPECLPKIAPPAQPRQFRCLRGKYGKPVRERAERRSRQSKGHPGTTNVNRSSAAWSEHSSQVISSAVAPMDSALAWQPKVAEKFSMPVAPKAVSAWAS